MSKDAFLVAVCPVCGIPWPSYTREDLRLIPHSRHAKKNEVPVSFTGTSERRPLVPCEGKHRVLAQSEYGENGEDRFHPRLWMNKVLN